MNDFSINFEWEDPLGAKGPELRATWARLSIVVNGYPVTRVYDDRLKAVRDAVYVPLYPLAEWLVANWWPLWNEPGPSSDRSHYDSRHSLVGAREGFALPPLRIRPTGSVTKLTWLPERLPANRLEFLGHGNVWTDTGVLKERLSTLIEAVIGRLEADGITDTLLQEDWQAIQSADDDERLFCECAGALGLDPYSLNDEQAEEIESVGRGLSKEIVQEFFRAARAEELVQDSEAISETLAKVHNNEVDLASLRDLREVMAGWEPVMGSTPWESGYDFARRLRAHLGLDGSSLKSIESVGAKLGIDQYVLESLIIPFSGTLTPYDALMGINDRSSPAFGVRPGLPPSRLFAFCRALFEYLSSSSSRSALITKAATERQKRNRAFAAELLAPSSALRSRVRTEVVTWELVEELAEEFGVSGKIIEHQLDNHRIASIQEP
jgi:hypothetical protein